MLSPRIVSTPRRSKLGSNIRSSSPFKDNSPINSSFGSKVRVVVRVRPHLRREIEASNPQTCIRILKNPDGVGEDTLTIQDPGSSHSESYKLDSCYGEKDESTQIFAGELEHILPMLFEGYSATIFAYGATGSGKTHTMQGQDGNPGLMTLALKAILALAQNTQSRIEVSYYELYMDRCYDLLDSKSNEIPVLEDGLGRIQLRGLTHVEVKTIHQFHELFAKACAQRKIGQTGLNDVSSRSHGALMITVTGNNSGIVTEGKLNLIDLAGNEDNRKTGNDGIRLVESTRINQSLFVLSNVINALNANERRVPFRDSKLTRILQDSLGGTGSAVMIACLNPASFQEAAQTLGLAARSRQIAYRISQNKTISEVSAEKVDTETRLKHWKENKGKTPGKSPARFSSPLQARLFSHSPSRFGPPQRVPLQRILASESPNSTRGAASPFSAEECSTAERISEDVSANPVIRTCNNNLQSQASFAMIRNPVFDAGEAYDTGKENATDGWQCTPIKDALQISNSPPLSERLRKLGTSFREALSPLPSSNLEIANKQQTPIQTVTPIQTLGLTGGTPLERFGSCSRNLQEALLKEYLNVLNTGTREELLNFKGIGKKRADCIIEQRQQLDVPFKELADLEKIGLSEKQAHVMFHNNVVKQMLGL